MNKDEPKISETLPNLGERVREVAQEATNELHQGVSDALSDAGYNVGDVAARVTRGMVEPILRRPVQAASDLVRHGSEALGGMYRAHMGVDREGVPLHPLGQRGITEADAAAAAGLTPSYAGEIRVLPRGPQAASVQGGSGGMEVKRTRGAPDDPPPLPPPQGAVGEEEPISLRTIAEQLGRDEEAPVPRAPRPRYAFTDLVHDLVERERSAMENADQELSPSVRNDIVRNVAKILNSAFSGNMDARALVKELRGPRLPVDNIAGIVTGKQGLSS